MSRKVLSILLMVAIVCSFLPMTAITANAAEQWLWPLEGCDVILSNFGWRDLDGNGSLEDKHQGIDIIKLPQDSTRGMPVRAAKSGTIIISKSSCSHYDYKGNCGCNGGAGNYVAIQHEDGTYSRYLHLLQSGVRGTGSVSQGEIIGYVGTSGWSYGYHLHFDMCTNINDRSNSLLNPMPTNSGITIMNTYSLPSGWPSQKTTYVFNTEISVTFDANGGSCGTAQKTITSGSAIGSLPTPTRSGYDFAGWYYDKAASHDDPVTSSSTFTSATTLYAHWASRLYTGNKIAFDAQGGQLPGATASHSIDGFNTGRGSSELIVYNCAGNTVNTNTYGIEVTVNADGKVTAKREYGDTSVLTVPTGGFVLSGHTNSSGSGGDFVGAIDVGYYVAYNKSANIAYVYSSKNAYLANQKYVSSGNSYGELPTPTKDGKVFQGWYTSSSGGTEITSSSTYSASTLYARWDCDHSYNAEYSPGNCVQYASVKYTCTKCGYSYTEYSGGEYSEWSTTYPTGIDASLVQSKTQYRYSDYETKTSYDPNLSGYTLISSTWETAGTGTVQYVKSWPSGFSTSHSLYSSYNKTPKTNAESTTDKTTINSDKITGYLYYHWCRGTYANGPINRATSPTQSGEFNSFHAFYSTTPPSSLTASSDGDGSYTYANGSCCKDSHWYYCVSVYTQTYTTYRKLFTYGRWGSWSSWSDAVYTANSNRKVETRTLYRYVNSQLGDHVWNNGIETTAPSCTEKGVKTYTCSACGTTKTEEIAALGHNYQDGYCTRCGAEDPNYQFVPVKLEVGTAAGKPGDTVTVPVSISDNSGFAGFTFVISYDASVMTLTDITKGEVLAESESGAFTKNVSGGIINWTDATNVTGNGTMFSLVFKISDQTTVEECKVELALKDGNSTNFVDENGRAKRAEIMAGEVLITPHSHEYTAEVVAPTCTEQGYTTYTCSCGDSYKANYVDALGHNYSYKVTTTPTTSAAGRLTSTCSRCSGTTSVTLPKLNTTDYSYSIIKTATCTATGTGRYTWKNTSYGSYSFDVTIAKTSHSYSSVITDPTCTEQGYTTYTCTCGDSYKANYVDALGHDMVDVPGKDATCTEDGYTSSAHCSRCDHAYAPSVLPATGHSWDNGVVTTPPTEEAEGVKTYTCTACGATKTESIPVLEHSHSYVATVTAPTCTEQGYTTYTCSCGDSYKADYTAALGHSYICTDNGADHTIACINGCGYSVTEPHDYSNGACECGSPDPYSGFCGENARWVLDITTGQLRIFGTGAMTNYTSSKLVPWYDFRNMITSVVMEEGVTTVGDYVFRNLDAVTGMVIPNSVTSVGVNSFSHCNKLATIQLSENLTEIGNSSFRDCVSLTDVDLPDSVTSIGEYAFCGSGLTYITIPEKVTEIGASAFSSATKLGHVHFLGDMPTMGTDAFAAGSENLLLCYPEGAKGWETCIYAASSKEYTVHSTATCTENGVQTLTCSCGELHRETFVEAIGHNTSEWIVDKEATCTEDGVKYKECTTCKIRLQTEAISALGHDMVNVPGKQATCTEDGYTSSAYCSRCDHAYAPRVIPATGHSWDNGVVTTPPTEEAEGVKTYTCTACGATKTEAIPVLDHSHSYAYQVVAPTCTEQGYTLYTCSCGDSFKENFVDALGHNASDWIVDLAPTCTVAGSMHTECTRCGALLQTSAIQPSGHTESDWLIDKEATCTEGGAKHKECTVCKLRLQTESIPALGHDYASVVTEPTCTEAGYTTYTCETCGHSYTGDAVPATGHDYEDGSCTHCGAEDPDWTEPEDPFVNPFIDVKENDYFYAPVLWAVQKGITNGTTPTTFSPYDPCTRGQIVTFLWRAFGSPEPEKDENPFTDVPENMYYYKAILWAVEQGITTGTSATTFSPEDTCTRGQVATFLWRACGKLAPEGSENPFTDVPETVYYYEPILWAVENGITNGTGNGKFSPEDSCTRGQIVTFLYRALAK